MDCVWMLDTVMISSAFQVFIIVWSLSFYFPSSSAQENFGTSPFPHVPAHHSPLPFPPLFEKNGGVLERHLSAIWAAAAHIPLTLILSQVRTSCSSGEPHCLPHGGLCSSFPPSCSSGAVHPASFLQTRLSRLPSSSFLRQALFGSFSRASTHWEKEGFQVPNSPGDFLLKGSLGEYLQSKWSAEIVFWYHALIS